MTRCAAVPAAAAVSPMGWWPSGQDVETAVDKMKGLLHAHEIAEVKGLAPLDGPLKAILDRHSSLLTFPSTRRKVIETLELMVEALNKLPTEVPESWTQDQIEAVFEGAAAAQRAIAQKLSKQIPEGSRYLEHRHVTAAAILLLAIAVWLAARHAGGIAWLVPAVPFLPLLSPAMQFVTGRAIDYVTIANHTDKQLKDFAEALLARFTHKGNEVMLETRIQARLDKLAERQDQQIARLSTENAALRDSVIRLQAAQGETNATLTAIFRLLKAQQGQQCAAAANQAEPANDPQQGDRVYG